MIAFLPVVARPVAALQKRVPVRVQVVEDNAVLRAVACMEIELSHDLELAGQASNGAEAVEVARLQRPDGILLDLDMPIRGGLDALPELLEIVPEATIVVYTSLDSAHARLEAGRRGAIAYVIKSQVPVAEALHIIRSHGGGPAGA